VDSIPPNMGVIPIKLQWRIVKLLISFGLVLLLFLVIPVSSIVFLAIIPALIFSVYSHRLFFVLIAGLVFLGSIGLFYGMIVGIDISQVISIVIFLYTIIYPYKLELNIFTALGVGMIFFTLFFLLAIVGLAYLIKYSEVRILVGFSYFSMVFTGFYLLVNMFTYIISPLRNLILNNAALQFALAIFYGIIPLIVLTLMFYWLFSFIDRRDRAQFKAKLVSKDNIFSKILAWIGYSTLILVGIVITVVMLVAAY